MDKIDKLLDENSTTLTASLKNMETFTKTLADNSGATGNFIRDAADAAHSLKPVAERFDKLLASAERTVKALDPKTIKSITGNVAGLSSNLNHFSQTGLRQYEQLAIDARKADRHARPRRAQFRTRSLAGHFWPEPGSPGGQGPVSALTPA